MAIETYFKNIADAIREKAGTSGLITPAQMPQAIADIPSGGGTVFLEPLYTNFHIGYINNGTYYYSPSNTTSYMDIYKIDNNYQNIIAFPGSTVGNRWYIALFNTDITQVMNNISGFAITNKNAPDQTTITRFYNNNYRFVVIQKTNTGDNSINSYLINSTEWS